MKWGTQYLRIKLDIRLGTYHMRSEFQFLCATSEEFWDMNWFLPFVKPLNTVESLALSSPYTASLIIVSRNDLVSITEAV